MRKSPAPPLLISTSMAGSMTTRGMLGASPSDSASTCDIRSGSNDLRRTAGFL